MVVNTPIDSTQSLMEMGETLSAAEVRPERRWLKSLKTNRFAMIAGIIVILLVIMAILAPWIVPKDPKFIDPSIRLLPPGPGHRFGTDDFGRDVLSRVIYGARVSLLIGAAVTLFSAVIGSVLGLLALMMRESGPTEALIMNGALAVLFVGLLAWLEARYKPLPRPATPEDNS